MLGRQKAEVNRNGVQNGERGVALTARLGDHGAA